MKPIWVKKGDTFFTHSHSWLGRLIRWGETDPGETPAWTNHTGVVVESGYIGLGTPQAVVIEALWTARRGPLKLNGVEVRVFRPVPIYDWAEVYNFEVEANTYVGDRYGWWKLGAQLADRLLFRGRKVISTCLFIKNRPICSFLAAWVNEKARPQGTPVGLDTWPGFGVLPQAADPDTMMKYCESHPEFWREIR